MHVKLPQKLHRRTTQCCSACINIHTYTVLEPIHIVHCYQVIQARGLGGQSVPANERSRPCSTALVDRAWQPMRGLVHVLQSSTVSLAAFVHVPVNILHAYATCQKNTRPTMSGRIEVVLTTNSKESQQKFSSLRNDGNRELVLVTIIAILITIQNIANCRCLCIYKTQKSTRYRYSRLIMHREHYWPSLMVVHYFIQWLEDE